MTTCENRLKRRDFLRKLVVGAFMIVPRLLQVYSHFSLKPQVTVLWGQQRLTLQHGYQGQTCKCSRANLHGNTELARFLPFPYFP
jgi:hypothetical protein